MDGDVVLSSLLYSSDDGLTWSAVKVHTDESTYTLDTSELPGGVSCRVKVVVNDGFNTAEEVSDPFFVDTKKPECMIFTPTDGASFNTLEDVVLSGVGFDLEDDDVDLVWSSDIDGYLGAGAFVYSPALSNGLHVITLKAVDSGGEIALDQVSILIGGMNTQVVNHLLCSSVGEDGSTNGIKTRFSLDEVVYSYLDLKDATIGQSIEWVYNGPNGISETMSLIT